MRKPFRAPFLLAAILVVFTLLLAETLVVKIQTTNLRKEPKFYGQTTVVLKAGETLEKLTVQGGWIQVRTSAGQVGWIHSSAVETPKFNLLASNKGLKTQASAGEVALASKGFNKQVEESYRAKHGEISYVWVDRMIKLKIPPSQMETFLKRGKLGDFGGPK